jgi:P27 family predicted phage terminase small subunit
MTRGRRPQPDALKAAKGNPGKRAIAPSTPTDADKAAAKVTSATKPPGKLTAAALSVWRQTAPELERMNFLRPTDRQAFARYCDAVARFWDVRQKLTKAGATYWTDSAHGKMQRINPLFIVEERLARRLTELEDRFGLSPSARQQIMLRLAQGQPALPFPPNPGATPHPDGPTPPAPPPESAIGLLGPSKLH